MAEMKPNAGYSNGNSADTIPYAGRTTLNRSAKVPIHKRQPNNPPRQDVSFTGRGVVPDYMSDHGLTMMPEINRTTLNGGTVPGSEGMMPPPGRLPSLQLGQNPDGGAGGAGSFATIGAFRARG